MELIVSAGFVFLGGAGPSLQATKQIAKVVRKRIFIRCTTNSLVLSTLSYLLLTSCRQG